MGSSSYLDDWCVIDRLGAESGQRRRRVVFCAFDSGRDIGWEWITSLWPQWVGRGGLHSKWESVIAAERYAKH